MIRQCSSTMMDVAVQKIGNQSTKFATTTISTVVQRVQSKKTSIVVNNKTFLTKKQQFQQQQKHRFFSSSTTAIPRTDGIIISRRVWNEIIKLKPIIKDVPKTKPVETSSTSSSWPRSVQVFGYVSGFILIPYLFVWCIVVATPNIRDDYFFPLLRMLPIPISISNDNESESSDTDTSTDTSKKNDTITKDDPKVTKKDNIIIEIIRKHFGEIDWDNLSYIEQHIKTIQYKLYDELTQEQRYQQKLINYYNLSNTIQQTVQFYLPMSSLSTSSTTISDIPSSIVLSSTNTLLQWLQQSIKSSNDNNDDNNNKNKQQLIQYYQQNPTAPILLDFPEQTDITTSTSKSNIDPNEPLDEQKEQQTIPKKDDFVKKMNLYSYWYYQDPAHILSSASSSSSSSCKSNNKKQQPAQTSTTTAAAVATNKSSTPIIVYDTNINMDDENKLLILIQQYEFDINQLQIELNDGSPTRHVDTILDELEYKKQQLRSAQWNRVSNKLKFW